MKHHCLKARMAWWRDGWQGELVVARVFLVGECWKWVKDEWVQGDRKGTDWQCDPESCKFDSDQGMVCGEDERPVLKWVL